MDIQTKRVFEAMNKTDGTRVLVDRVWPRGMTREKVKADIWLKSIAPGTELRKWFGHDPDKWQEFKHRYFKELDANPDTVKQLLELATKQRLTLLYSARDTNHNQAVALKDYLLTRTHGQSG